MSRSQGLVWWRRGAHWLAPRGPDVAALAFVLLGVAAFHARGLRPGYAFLPVDLAANTLPWRGATPPPLHNVLVSDPFYEFYPFLAAAVEHVRRQGSLLLWTPLLFLGHPSVADPLAQTFYPIFLLGGLVFGAARSLALAGVFHAALAALFTYGWLRAAGARPAGAGLGALTYALGGYMVNWIELSYWSGTLAWLPGIRWGYEAAVRRRRPRAVALAAVAFACALLAGHLQLLVDFCLFLGLYAALQTWDAAACGRPWWPATALAAIAGLGALLAGVQIVPFAEALQLTLRTVSQSLTDALPPAQLLTLLVPTFFGSPTQPAGYWGDLNYLEGTAYAGLPALLLACLAPCCAAGAARRRALAGAVLLLFTIAFAVGAPGVRALDALPLVRFGSLHRAVAFLPLAVAFLASCTLDAPRLPLRAAAAASAALAALMVGALLAPWGRAGGHWSDLQAPVLRAAAVLSLTLLLLALRERLPRRRGAATGALVALAFLDLFLAGSGFNPTGKIADLARPTAGIEYLRAHAGSADGAGRVAALQLGDAALFGPNVLALFGLADAGGYTSLVPAGLQRLVGGGDPKDEAPGIGYWFKQNPNIVFFSRPSRRLLDLLDVGYVVTPPAGAPGMAPGTLDPVVAALDPDWAEVYRGEIVVYARRRPAPHAFVVYAAEPIRDDGTAVAHLLNPSFDPQNAAVTADRLDLPARPTTPATPARMLSVADGRLDVEATASQPGLLVLADQYAPSWQATVDGAPAPVLRVDYVLRGVQLTPGRHRVVLRYAPASLRLGALLSAAGLAGIVLLLALDRPRRGGAVVYPGAR